MDYAIRLWLSREPYILRDGNQALADAVIWHLQEAHSRRAERMEPMTQAQEIIEARRLDGRLRHLCGATPLIETQNFAIQGDAFRNTDWDRLGQVLRQYAREMPPPRPEGGSERRAHETLLLHLDERQRIDWYRHKAFRLTSQYGATYHIERKTTSNVLRTTDMRRFCVVFQDMAEYPPSDLWLAQKLLLECDERRFLRVAEGSFVIRTTIRPTQEP